MPSYKTHDPKGWGGDPKRGAALGRSDYDVKKPAEYTGKIEVHLVPLDTGGYDPNGTYFGTGSPLFWIASEDGQIDWVSRYKNPHDALEEVKALYPKATVSEGEGVSTTIEDVELDVFTRQYLESALAYSTYIDDEGCDRDFDEEYGIEDFAVEALLSAKRECEEFQATHKDLLEKAYEHPGYSAGSAGHDFWLTRNGAGVGFWDRGLGDIGEKLSEACQHHEQYLYVGDDGKVHIE
jgi:hypothetical protein